MVDQAFLAIGAVTFLVVLILILRNGANQEPQKLSKKDKQKQKPVQPKVQKPKKGRSALKKNERSGIVSEWQVVQDSAAKDAHEVLEFLKGKDPSEIAKQQAAAAKQPTKKKGKKTKDEAQSSEDSATDDGSLEGFEKVKKREKTPADDKKKKKKEKKQEEAKDKDQSKPYFRLLNPDGTPVKDEKAAKKGQRKGNEVRINSGDEAQGEKKARPEGEKREKKPRLDGEKREPRERKEGEPERKPREPRPPREPKEERRPITSPPNVKYEEADLNDILNNITKDYKPKAKAVRVPSEFSRIERKIILKILGKLEARDLVALSGVNHHFLAVSRFDALWKSLLLRDFGLKDQGKHKNFRATYRAEFNRKRSASRRGKKDEAAVPQGEEKDTKGKKERASKEEEVTQE